VWKGERRPAKIEIVRVKKADQRSLVDEERARIESRNILRKMLR
jgi:hypothetical protein